jgi:hypothetical protein
MDTPLPFDGPTWTTFLVQPLDRGGYRLQHIARHWWTNQVLAEDTYECDDVDEVQTVLVEVTEATYSPERAENASNAQTP